MKKLATLISNELKSLREAVPDTGQEAVSIALRIAGLTTLNTKTLKEIQGTLTSQVALTVIGKRI